MATTKHVESIIDNNGKAREVEVFVFHNPSKRKRENKEEVSGFNAVKTKQNKPKKTTPTGGAILPCNTLLNDLDFLFLNLIVTLQRGRGRSCLSKYRGRRRI